MKLIFMNNTGVSKISADLMCYDYLKDIYENEVWDLSEIYNLKGLVINIQEAIVIHDLNDFDRRLHDLSQLNKVVIISNMVEKPWRKLAPIAKKYGVPIINTQKNNFTGILNRKIAFDLSIKVSIKTRFRLIMRSILPIRCAYKVLTGSFARYDYQISSYNSKPESVKHFVKTHNVKYDEYLQNLNSECPIKNNFILFIDGAMCEHPVDYKDYDPNFNREHYLNQLNAYFDVLEEKTGLPVVISLHPVSAVILSEKDFGGRKTTYGITAQLIQHCEFTVSHYSTSLINVVLAKKPALILSSKEIESSSRARVETMAFAFAKMCGFKIDSMDNPKYPMPVVQSEMYDSFIKKYLVNTDKIGLSNGEMLLDLLRKIELD